jgi:hypothetical protein
MTFSRRSFSNSAGHIGDGNLCVEISLIGRRRCRFLYFAFDKLLNLHSHQGLVMVETF